MMMWSAMLVIAAALWCLLPGMQLSPHWIVGAVGARVVLGLSAGALLWTLARSGKRRIAGTIVAVGTLLQCVQVVSAGTTVVVVSFAAMLCAAAMTWAQHRQATAADVATERRWLIPCSAVAHLAVAAAAMFFVAGLGSGVQMWVPEVSRATAQDAAAAAISVAVLAAVATLNVRVVLSVARVSVIAGIVCAGARLGDADAALKHLLGVLTLLALERLVWTMRAESRAATQRSEGFDPVAYVALALIVTGVFQVAAFALPFALGDVTMWEASTTATLACMLALSTFGVARIDALQTAGRATTPFAPAQRDRFSNRQAMIVALPAVVVIVALFASMVHSAGVSGLAPERAMLLVDRDARMSLALRLKLPIRNLDDERSELAAVLARAADQPDAVLAMMQNHLDAGHAPDALALESTLPWTLASSVPVRLKTARAAIATGELSRARDALLFATAGSNDSAQVILAQLTLLDGDASGAAARASDVIRRRGLTMASDPVAAGDAIAIEAAVLWSEAELRASRPLEALSLAMRAYNGADVSRARVLKVRALAARARAHDGKNAASDALNDYRAAIRLAMPEQMYAEAAELWLDVGQLLTRSEATIQHRYACALMARDALAQASSSLALKSLRENIAGIITATEKAMAPADVQSVQSELKRYQDEVMRLNYDPNTKPMEVPSDEGLQIMKIGGGAPEGNDGAGGR